MIGGTIYYAGMFAITLYGPIYMLDKVNCKIQWTQAYVFNSQTFSNDYCSFNIFQWDQEFEYFWKCWTQGQIIQ